MPIAIGLCAAVVWAHYLPSIWPLPPRSDLPVELQWSLWWESALLTALGFTAAALAMRAVRYWQLAILLTSGFLVVSVFPTMVGDALKATSVNVWINQFRGVRSESLYYLFVVPLYHLALVVAVLVFVALKSVNRHSVANAA